MLDALMLNGMYREMINTTCDILKKGEALKKKIRYGFGRAFSKVKGVVTEVKEFTEEFFHDNDIYPEMEEDYSLLSIGEMLDLLYAM